MSNEVVAEYKLTFKDLASNGLLKVAGVASKMTSGLATAAKAVGGLGTVVSGGVGLMTKSYLDGANEIENFARLANISVEDFQKMAIGAKRYGIEGDKLSDMMKDFNEKMGEFRDTKGGGMKDFFEKIAPKVGVTAEQFKKLSGKDALQLYVDSLQKAGLSQEQMSFYLESMGSDFTSLIPLLKDGGKELNAVGTMAEKSGAILSKLDIENAQKINADLKKIGMQWGGFKNSLIVGLMPLTQSITSFFVDNQAAISEYVGKFSAKVKEMVSALNTTENGERFKAVLASIGAVIGAIGTAISIVVPIISDVITTGIDYFTRYKDIIIAVGAGIGAFIAVVMPIGGVLATFAATFGTIITTIKTVGMAFALLLSPVGLVGLAIGTLVAAGVYLYQNWDIIKAKAAEVFNSLPAPVHEAFANIKQAFSTLKLWATTAFDFLAPYVGATMAVVSGIFTAKWLLIKGVFSTNFSAIKGIVTISFNVIKAVLTTGISVLATVFNTGFYGIKNTVKTAFNAIKALISGDIRAFVSIIGTGLTNALGIAISGLANIISAFGTFGKRFFSIGAAAVQGLINGIRQKIQGAINTARELASKVSDTVKSYFNVNSPSRLFMGIGGSVSKGLAIGIKNQAGVAVSQAKRMASDVASVDFAVGSLSPTTMPNKNISPYNPNGISADDISRPALARIASSQSLNVNVNFDGAIKGATGQANISVTGENTNYGGNMPFAI